MGFIDEYKCVKCHTKFVDDGRLFYYNSNSNETIDYILVFSTAGCARDSKIKGFVNQTYCKDCGKFLRVYTIREVEGEFENICEIVMEGINNHIKKLGDEIQNLKEVLKQENYIIEKKDSFYLVKYPGLKDWLYQYFYTDEDVDNVLKYFLEGMEYDIEFRTKEYEKYLNAIYLVEDKSISFNKFNSSEKVNCPVCGRKINKFIKSFSRCPKCGWILIKINSIHVD